MPSVVKLFRPPTGLSSGRKDLSSYGNLIIIFCVRSRKGLVVIMITKYGSQKGVGTLDRFASSKSRLIHFAIEVSVHYRFMFE
jgi:hypothetical protein